MLIKLTCIVGAILFYAAVGFALYLLSGKQNMPWLWAVLTSQTLISIVGVLVLSTELIQERMKPKGKDKDPLGVWVLSVLCLAQLAVAVLDISKWHLSDNVPTVLQIIALLLQSAGWIGLYWSMYINKFFSSAIRMQEDRGQMVITAGPYHFIRHPGYAFASLAFIAESIALGSWISIVPALLLAAYMGYRTLLEEKMLHANLPGYSEYANQTRYRWIPGVW